MGILALVAVLIAAVAMATSPASGPASPSAGRPAAGPGQTAPPQTSGPARPQPARPAGGAAGRATIRRLISLGLPIYCGGPHGNEVAFTFDDGPGVYTHYALRKLAQAGERVTWFDVGKSIDAWPGYLPRELALGAIGDHTYTHPELPALPPAQISWQLQATRQKIQAQVGQAVDLWRPPYELHDAATDRIARGLGLLEILWNIDSQDSVGADWARIITNVEAGLRPGAIILMHENHGQTIRALTTLLPELRRRHLRSVSIPELMASDPPSNAQVRLGRHGCAGRFAVAPGSGG